MNLQKEAPSSLEQEILDFFDRVAGKKGGLGVTAAQKKLECELLLQKLREDRKGRKTNGRKSGPRTIPKERSKKYKGKLRFILAQAEAALAQRRN